MNDAKIEKFDKGTFVLSIEDPINEEETGYRLVMPPYKAVSKGTSDESIQLPSIDSMSYDGINNLVSNVEIKPVNSNEDCAYKIRYESFMNSYQFYNLIKDYGGRSISITIPGLKVIASSDDLGRVSMTSDSFFYGKNNSSIKWYLSVLNRYMGINNIEDENK